MKSLWDSIDSPGGFLMRREGRSKLLRGLEKMLDRFQAQVEVKKSDRFEEIMLKRLASMAFFYHSPLTG